MEKQIKVIICADDGANGAVTTPTHWLRGVHRF